MSTPAYDVERKYDNSKGIYYGVGPKVHVLEMPRYSDFRRYLCLTDLLNDCQHVDAVKCFLSNAPVEAAV